MGLISKTYTFANGTIIDAIKFNVDFDTLYNEFNGLMDNANIKSGAAIEGSKLADNPAGIPSGKYNAGSIKGPDISNSAAVDGDRAIDHDHLKNNSVISRVLASSATVDADRAVTKDHVQNNQLPLSKLKGVLEQSTAFTISGFNTTDAGFIADTPVMTSIYRETSGGNYRVVIGARQTFHAFGAVHPRAAYIDSDGTHSAAATVAPATPIPAASKILMSFYIENLTYNSGTGQLAGNLITLSIDRT